MASTVPAAPDSPAGDDPLVGLRVGEYQILERLSEGGMGVVYRGVQPVIKKRVAIKVLKPGPASDTGQVNRLVAEAEAVNAIGHRSIVDIFSLGALPDGRPYIVMEYLDGEPLDVWLARQGRPPLSVALELLVEMCGPLAAAHRAGVIHRDLKPSNVFLCTQPDGSKFLKLLDFGLAKRALGLDGSTAQTSLTMVAGTPDYMAPEQARALPISPRSDIYSLGVVAFELLTGQVPFMGATPMDVMMSHVSKQAPRVRTFEPALPAVLDDLVARMLAKEPQERPQTIEEVRQTLEDVLMAGDELQIRPSQSNLPRLTGLEPPRPSAPVVAALPSEPMALPEPLPLVVGTSIESGLQPPAVVVGTPLESGESPRVEAASQPVSAPAPAPSSPPAAAPSVGEVERRLTPGPTPAVRRASRPSFPAQPPPRSRWPWWLLLVLGLGGIGGALWHAGFFAALAREADGAEASSESGAAATGEGAPAAGAAEAGGAPKGEAGDAQALKRRLTRLVRAAQQQKVSASGLGRLKGLRQEVSAADSAAERAAVGKRLDAWEAEFLTGAGR